MTASDPAEDAAAVTPSDSTVVNFRGLYVGGAGNVAITTAKGNVVTFASIPAGTFMPVQGSKVMSTNTTATSIVALK